MALFDSSPNKIQYDSEKVAEMKRKISKTSEELKTLNQDVLKAIQDMEKDWKTTEGKKFLSDIDMDWTVQVDKYVDILDTLTSMLQETENIYSDLTEKAEKISF